MFTPEVKPSGKPAGAALRWIETLERLGVPPSTPEAIQAKADSISLFLRHWRSALLALMVLLAGLAWIGWEEVSRDRWRVPFLSGSAALNTAFQAATCLALERHERTVGKKFWRAHRALVASITVNAVLWSVVPLIARELSTHAMLLACIFNAMILFSVASSPGSPAMLLAAGTPLLIGDFVVVTVAGLPSAAICYAGLMVLIIVSGLRLQRETRSGMQARYIAEKLAKELQEKQALLVRIESEKALLLERERLTRDMHDGLGTALLAALTSVTRGELPSQSDLAATLADCVDELRNVITSLEPMDHDLVALLAGLRGRLEQRLRTAGIQLVWQIEDLPRLPWLDATHALHITRLLQEACANVIKHAKAWRVSVSAQSVTDAIEILFTDDGQGFDTSAESSGHGLRSLQARADALGGRLRLASQLGEGTRIRLELPLIRGVATSG